MLSVRRFELLVVIVAVGCANALLNYDLRKAKPKCQTIRSIKDQSFCDSSWAVASTSAMADRLCIATDYEFNENLSAADLMDMGKRTCEYSGDIAEAVRLLKEFGVVTGGDYESNEGCIPYPYPPCGIESRNDNIDTCKSARNYKIKRTLRCVGDEDLDYKKDKRYNRDENLISEPNKEEKVQKQLIQYGSCIVTMSLFTDFENYTNGVYKRNVEDSEYLGPHYVRLIGWGISDDAVEYWLAANSWGKFWGENGFFRIQRRENGCEFGKEIYCPVPVSY